MTEAVATRTGRASGVPARPLGPGPRRRRRTRADLSPNAAPRWAIYAPLALYLLFTLIPFYWILLFAFRPAGSTSLLPWPITFAHFSKVWNGMGFAVFFKNSVIIASLTMILSAVIAVAGGYALARYKFRGKGVFLALLLCSQFVPGAMLLIPLFGIFHSIGLLNSIWSVVVSDTVFHLPLSIIMMGGFIMNIPMELEEAAWVDGCGRFRGFLTSVLPLLLPGIVAIGSFSFIESWNNFLFALMFLNNQGSFTVPVGLNYLIGENSADFGALAAGGVLAVVPVVLIFAYVQKFLVRGLSAGAVKG